MNSSCLALLLLTLGTATAARAQHSEPACPMHAQHQRGQPAAGAQSDHNHAEHAAEVDHRGDEAMGFDHLKTTHHFRLKPDGGVIEVAANDPKDTASRDQIRHHLASIAQSFSAGDFTKPRFIHAQEPPGAATMRRLKAEIKCRFEETARGGQVRIVTGNPEALAAIHEFLRFQIEEHRTGDPQEVRE